MPRRWDANGNLIPESSTARRWDASGAPIPTTPAQKKPAWYDRAATTGLRIIPSVAGAVIGTALTAPTVVGAAGGLVGGGAIGAGLGETAAQGYEQWRGLRKGFNKKQIAAETAMGAIPIKGGSALKTAAKSAGMGALATQLTSKAETGEWASPGETAVGAGLSGALGGVLGRAGRKPTVAKTPSVVTPDPQKIALSTATKPAVRTVIDPKIASGATPLDPLLKRSNNRDIVTPSVLRSSDDPGEQLADAVILLQADAKGKTDFGKRHTVARSFQEGQQTGIKGGRAVDPQASTTAEYAALQLHKRKLYETVASGMPNATPSEIAEAAGKDRFYSQAVLDVARAKSDVGRALNLTARKVPGGAFSVLDEGIVTAGRLGMTPDEIAALMVKAKDDPDVWMRELRAIESRKATKWDKFNSYITGNVLMGPATQIRNTLGNLTNLALRPAETLMGAAVDKAKVATGRQTERTVYASEAADFVRGALAAKGKAFSEFKKVLDQGFSTVQVKSTGGLDTGRVEFKTGGKWNPWNLTGRIMEGTDTFFRMIAEEGEKTGRLATLAKQATAKGIAPGSPQYLKMEADALQAAKDAAARITFQEKPGKAIGHLIEAKKAIPASHAFAMFIKTPSNIIKQGLEWTPAGWVMKRGRGGLGTRIQNEAQAKAAAGTVGLTALYGLAASGRLSGAGPKDPLERASLMREGWRPNSIKIGDEWYSYNIIQPLAVPMGLVANAYEAVQDQQNKKLSGLPDVMAATALRLGNTITNQSFLTGVNDLLESLNGGPDKARAFVNRMAQTVVPMSAAARSVTNAVDPIIRKPTTTVEAWKSIIPGASQSVPARLDPFGEPVRRVGGPVERGVNVFGRSPVRHDPVSDGLSRLKIGVQNADPEKTINVGRESVPLSPQDGATLSEAKGKALYALLEPLFTRPGFNALPLDQQERIVKKTKSDVFGAVQQRAALAVRSGRPLTLEDLLRGLPRTR